MYVRRLLIGCLIGCSLLNAQEAPAQEESSAPQEQVQNKEVSHESPPAEETVGIDTVDIDDPAGNWLFKRIWWERAEGVYEKIKAKVNEVFEARMTFFSQRTDLDRTVFDPFYMETGFGRGELQELITDLMAFVEDQRVKQGALDEEELAFVEQLRQQQQSLQKLHADIEAVNALDRAIDDALATLMEQINASRQQEQKSWDAFKAIAQALSDKKARELYYSMETYKENVNAILGYISNEFTQYFDKQVAAAKEQSHAVLDAVKQMKAKGINFKTHARKLEEINKKFTEGAQQAEEQEETRWWQWPWVALKAVWNGIASIFSAIAGLFTGSTE